ncbi:MAG: glyoxalase [Brevundimonas sp.]|uniref:VOC family protein n=1 Tax=Brevundimonas sp. TaxID=1871086 RepID=UPI000DB600D7|nr:VOC family protein [Brevundimonas sp.]PZU00302.1 MAG: glyoxalase [Brevundimonas sp.]
MTIQSLAYIVLETTDLDAWRRFGCEIVGMAEAEDSGDDALLLRMDGRPFRVRVEKGAQDRFLVAGWQCATRAAFAAARTAVEAAGVATESASTAEARARSFQAMFRCTDPAGNRLEIGWGHTLDYRPFISPVGVAGFVTGEMGLGHVVLPAQNLAAAYDFYTQVLGFGDSDEARFFMQGWPDDPGLGFHFLHCDNPRHHSLALGEIPVPSGLVHFMVEVATLDDVGRGYDRALNAGVHISATLGKHSNDEMVSFYMRTPAGCDLEYGTGGLRPDWSSFTPTFSLKESLWGHKWDRG